jgi:hypothetical protein
VSREDRLVVLVSVRRLADVRRGYSVRYPAPADVSFDLAADDPAPATLANSEARRCKS